MKLISSYIYIPVSNLSEAAQWYKKVLGFELFYEDSYFYELRTEGGLRILLINREGNLNSHMDYTNGPQPVYGFVTGDIKELRKGLIEQEIATTDIMNYAGASFTFKDLEGNVIEVWSDYYKKQK